MLVEYAATEMVYLDDFYDADPNHKSFRENCITTFFLHVSQCIIFNQTNHVEKILIADASLKSFYSRLGFKVIKDFATSTNVEGARSRFHYKTEKSKAEQKKAIGLQCLHTIPRHVTFLHDNQINFNIHKNVFRDLDADPTSETWFTNKYIEDNIKKNVDKTRGQLASDEMEYDIRRYIDSLKHDPFWVGRITNDINKLLFNREYIDLLMQIYIQWSGDNSNECLPHFEIMALSQFKVYIEVEKNSML